MVNNVITYLFFYLSVGAIAMYQFFYDDNKLFIIILLLLGNQN
jgi:hypothetical protein